MLPAITVFLMLIISCTKDIQDFTIGSDFVESDTKIHLIDTFSVNISTVWIDSIPTSMIDTILVGKCYDNIFGSITSNSFWQIGLPEDISVQSIDIFDSITLSIQYSGYYYGDTLQPLTVRLYQLVEPLETREDGYLYNTSKFRYADEPIGVYTFYPRPKGSESIFEVRVDDAFGKELLENMKYNEQMFSSDDNFITYYPGFALITDTCNSASIVGFDVNDENLYFTLYSHRIREMKVESEHIFPLVNNELQFNQIVSDFRYSDIENINTRGDEYSSGMLFNKAYMQGGTGLMVKISFPSLPEFQLFENSLFLKAELEIKPERISYINFDLPQRLYLYNTNKYNQVESILYDSDDNVVSSVLVLDEIFHEKTAYTFDITEFIKDEFSDSYFDRDHGILISLSYEEYICSLKRLVVDVQDNRPKLKFYYVSY